MRLRVCIRVRVSARFRERVIVPVIARVRAALNAENANHEEN